MTDKESEEETESKAERKVGREEREREYRGDLTVRSRP